MRYAIFSDIHSNLEAYEATMAAMKKEGADSYYCAGDIVGYGADPAQCISKTKELAPKIVAGNHDWAAVGLADITCFNPSAKEAVLWTADALGREDKKYLKGLRPVERGDFVLVHGSLNRPEEFEYILNFDTAHKTFLLMEEFDIYFIGHTHVAGVWVENSEGRIGYNPSLQVKLEEGKKYIVNVGSVGQPRDNDPRAAYCIYDTDEKTVEIKRVAYDIKTAQGKIIDAGLPKGLAKRLSSGT